MNLRLKQFLSKQTLTNLKRITTISTPSSSSAIVAPHRNFHYHNHNHNHTKQHLGNAPLMRKSFHSSPYLNYSFHAANAIEDDEEDESAINEFLSRFVYIMRGKLNEEYPDCDKPTIDAMLLVIVEKLTNEMEKGDKLGDLSDDLSEDLWKIVWEVSNNVYKEMEREKKKEKMKMFLQSEDVKAMSRFATDVGVRGDMLRELRFKWAREEMEKAEFYERLEEFGKPSKMVEAEVVIKDNADGVEVEDDFVGGGGGGRNGGLPKRHGKFKYKLYGLDLSNPQWREVADKIHEAEDVIWPQEAKPLSEECRLITEKIFDLSKMDDYDESDISPLLNEWKDSLQPTRVDWISLLDTLKEKDRSLYLKVAEHVLDEPSFEANNWDYSKLIDVYAKENRVNDVERLLKKKTDSGILSDTVTLTTLVHMYSRTNNLKQAQEAYEGLISQGLKPDLDVYTSMIMLYVNAGEHKKAELLLRQMEVNKVGPTLQIYMALLQMFAKNGDIEGAQRIVTSMQFAGFQPTIETVTLLLEACDISGDCDAAKNYFDHMMKLGIKPDDRCTSHIISVYAKKNRLESALRLLLRLEKDGFEPGISTYCVLVDWMGKLQLVDEAEQILNKIAQLGEAPPFKIQVSLCNMYARAGNKKKALQTLGVLESKKDLLKGKDFERIIEALTKGGFMQDAQRMTEVMKAQGFTPSETLKNFSSAAQFVKSVNRKPVKS